MVRVAHVVPTRALVADAALVSTRVADFAHEVPLTVPVLREATVRRRSKRRAPRATGHDVPAVAHEDGLSDKVRRVMTVRDCSVAAAHAIRLRESRIADEYRRAAPRFVPLKMSAGNLRYFRRAGYRVL